MPGFSCNLFPRICYIYQIHILFGFIWQIYCCVHTKRSIVFLLFALSVYVCIKWFQYNFVGTQVMSGEFITRLPKPEKVLSIFHLNAFILHITFCISSSTVRKFTVLTSPFQLCIFTTSPQKKKKKLSSIKSSPTHFPYRAVWRFWVLELLKFVELNFYSTFHLTVCESCTLIVY